MNTHTAGMSNLLTLVAVLGILLSAALSFVWLQGYKSVYLTLVQSYLLHKVILTLQPVYLRYVNCSLYILFTILSLLFHISHYVVMHGWIKSATTHYMRAKYPQQGVLYQLPVRRKGWHEESLSEGEEQEKASDGKGTSTSTDEREVSSETSQQRRRSRKNRSENWFRSRQTIIFAPLSIATRVMTT